MALSVADRIPLDRIGDRARAARPGHTVLVVIAAVLFGLGWAAFKACALSWLAVAWCGCAVIEGWQSARAARHAAERPR